MIDLTLALSANTEICIELIQKHLESLPPEKRVEFVNSTRYWLSKEYWEKYQSKEKGTHT